MTRAAAIMALLSSCAVLAGCADNVTFTEEPPGGLEYSVAVGNYSGPDTGPSYPSFYAEIPVRDKSLLDHSLLFGLGAGPPSDPDPFDYDEGDSVYYESVCVRYRHYYGLMGKVGARKPRAFWQAGMSAGSVLTARYPAGGPSWDPGDWEESGVQLHVVVGGGIRSWFSKEGSRTPFFLELSLNAHTASAGAPWVGFAFGGSFRGEEPGPTEVSYREAKRPVRRARSRRAEIFRTRREEAERRRKAREKAEREAAARRAEARKEARARRMELKKKLQKGSFGVRTGMLLPASGETADYDQSMVLGLRYRLPRLPDAKVSGELALDFGLPEEVGGYESSPVMGGFNLLFDLASRAKDPRGCLVAGFGGAVEFVKEQTTGDEHTNTIGMLKLGVGMVFADGRIDARLTYSFFGGSENLNGRPCFTVTCSF